MMLTRRMIKMTVVTTMMTRLVRFLDLKKELSSFQREAEESDRVVNDFIKVDLTDEEDLMSIVLIVTHIGSHVQNFL